MTDRQNSEFLRNNNVVGSSLVSEKNTDMIALSNHIFVWGQIFSTYINQNNIRQQMKCRGRCENPAVCLLNMILKRTEKN